MTLREKILQCLVDGQEQTTREVVRNLNREHDARSVSSALCAAVRDGFLEKRWQDAAPEDPTTGCNFYRMPFP